MVILNHMLKGFKDFILRGNVIDLAVAFIMGAAFNEVVKALVNSILMPAISMVVGVQNYDNFLAFGDVKVGVFLTAVVNFLLVAAALYFAVVMPMKKLNARISKKKAEDKEDTELSLLKEIRDSLATKKLASRSYLYLTGLTYPVLSHRKERDSCFKASYPQQGHQ